MQKTRPFHRRKILLIFICFLLLLLFLAGRLAYLMIARSGYYTELADDLHERERSIKAARGRILDRNGTILADNRTVCTISVIHSQITDAEEVIRVLCEELGMEEDTVRARVEKNSSIERIKSNVDKETGDRIRSCGLDGVKVDEDYKRYYPFESLASKVLGFTGADNQGIIGLEVRYEEVLAGTPGTILTVTDARGIEIEDTAEMRIEPVAGNDLVISLDANIQQYVEQAAYKVLEEKQADSVSIIVMNPQNGELYAMTNVPEFDLNDPYTLSERYLTINNGEERNDSASTEESGEEAASDGALTGEELQNALNQMWRNGCINDTYEPGSTFKIITAAAGLEEGVVTLEDSFYCPGYKLVDDRRIRCHKTVGHGSETFLEAAQNSCNPVFIEVGLRLGVDNYFKYFNQFGLNGKTGIDLPGEAATIMHKKENVGQVELATISFGQSFQITPIQLITTASSIVNGGIRITPHFAVSEKSEDGTLLKVYQYAAADGAGSDTGSLQPDDSGNAGAGTASDTGVTGGERILSEETSATMRYLLEQVVDGGSGKNAYIEGYRIGGKTATSETLPRGQGKYISSFVGFAPADDPQVICLCVINNPQGTYYGGTIAAPVVKDIFENILPYLGIEKAKTETTETEAAG
ncbi:MAG: peptidoglycan glycosyltransferase [Lachnospiraceae bacterium]|nr:peptidoglycan glycosyltransferase [Lachnospiraceae bacterium]